MDGFVADVRRSIRALARSRGFTAAAVATLALGIGANASVFAVARGVLLRPLPFADPDAVVRLWSNHVERGLDRFSVSAADYLDWREQNRVFSEMAAYDRQRTAVLQGADGRPQQVEAARASAELFGLLGVPPALGRAFHADEARPGGAAVAVVTDEFWRNALGGDPAVAGREIVIDEERFTIVGVMPPEFVVPANPAAVWTPLVLQEGGDRANRYLRVLGRLRPGVEVEAARSDLGALTARLAEAYPGTNAGWSITVWTMSELVIGTTFRQAVLILVGVVAVVLLIACANVASLALARAVERRREAAVRLALGASRGRIVRESLTESLVIGVAAGLAGALLGSWGVDLLHATSAGNVPRLDEVRVDGVVIGAAVALSLVTSLLLGLAPALHGARTDVGAGLREGGRGLAGGMRTRRARSALLVTEVTLALVLMVGAGLLLESLWRLQRVELGFDPEDLLVAPVTLPAERYGDDAVLAFYRELAERAARLPGVRSAALVSRAPFHGANSALTFATEAWAAANRQDAPDTDYRAVTPGYFETTGVALLRGRDFTEPDRTGPEVVIVSESLARAHFPSIDPIGQRIRVGDVANGPWRTIVGVAADARYQTLETPEVRPMTYLPHRALPDMTLVLRAEGRSASALAGAVRGEIAAMDERLTTGELTVMDDLVSAQYAQRRFLLVLFGVFAGLAVTVAGVGIYGTTAYTVAQRRRELGVRMALGAGGAHVRRLVLRQGVGLAALGVAGGLAAAAGLVGLMERLLFETEAANPLVFLGVAALLLVLAGAASYVPARRATRLDPLSVLRDAS